MVLQPAFADSDPPSNVSVIVELGAIVCVPVTSVATKLSPSSSLRGARTDGDACAEADADPVPPLTADPPDPPDPQAASPATSTPAPSTHASPRHRILAAIAASSQNGVRAAGQLVRPAGFDPVPMRPGRPGP